MEVGMMMMVRHEDILPKPLNSEYNVPKPLLSTPWRRVQLGHQRSM
jgi:hypothetical protein